MGTKQESRGIRHLALIASHHIADGVEPGLHTCRVHPAHQNVHGLPVGGPEIEARQAIGRIAERRELLKAAGNVPTRAIIRRTHRLQQSKKFGADRRRIVRILATPDDPSHLPSRGRNAAFALIGGGRGVQADQQRRRSMSSDWAIVDLRHGFGQRRRCTQACIELSYGITEHPRS